MKHTKRLLAVLLTLVLLCTGVPFAFAEDVTIVDSGTCGDNLTWTLDSEGTLTISGEGRMQSYNGSGGFSHGSYNISTDAPWGQYHNSIKKVVIEGGVTRIISFLGYNALTAIEVEVENVEYSSLDGILYNKEQTTLIQCPNGKMQVTIPDSVTHLGDGAFMGCTALTSVTIPNSVMSIGNSAFSCCSALTSVTIPNSVTSIGNEAFHYCYALTDVAIPDSVSSIGYLAFSGCFTLDTIYVSSDNSTFSSVDGILYNKDQTTLIQCPAGKTDVTIPDGVSSIEDSAFSECYMLESVTIPEGVTIDKGCFADSIIVPPRNYVFRGKENPIDDTAFVSDTRFKNVPEELQKELFLAALSLIEPTEEIQPFLDSLDDYLEGPDYESGEEWFYPATIHCHAGSTAEAYAIEHGMDYDLTHFFEGDWNYDWDNLIRWRKCIHCDERETEPLETETPGGAEIVGPADGDTSFDVEPVSTDYVLIREALGEKNVVKAFDISLKNNDGVHVQPKGTVKVKLPGDFKTGDYKVYRVNADGTYTDMQAFREGSHLVFYTDHFSLYVVVDESAGTEPDTPDMPDTPDAPVKESKVKNILRTVFEFLQKLILLLFQK